MIVLLLTTNRFAYTERCQYHSSYRFLHTSKRVIFHNIFISTNQSLSYVAAESYKYNLLSSQQSKKILQQVVVVV